MSNIDTIRKAVTVMDGAAQFIAQQRAKLAEIKSQADAAGADLPALNEAIADLEREAGELAAAMAEGTSAAPAEQPSADTAPVVDPATVDTAAP